jgi:hypothetical protein
MGVGIKKSGRRTKATFVQVGFAALVVIGVALAFAFTQGQARAQPRLLRKQLSR